MHPPGRKEGRSPFPTPLLPPIFCDSQKAQQIFFFIMHPENVLPQRKQMENKEKEVVVCVVFLWPRTLFISEAEIFQG